MTIRASVSPVVSSATWRRSGILAAVLELQRVDRDDFLADLVAALGVQEGVQARTGADAQVVVALRADVDVLLEVGLVEDGVARRALDPQALRDRPPLARVGLLDLRGNSFSSQLIVYSLRAARGTCRPWLFRPGSGPNESGTARVGRAPADAFFFRFARSSGALQVVDRCPDAGDECARGLGDRSRGCSSSRWTSAEPITTASATRATPGRHRVPDAETDTHRNTSHAS
jgi:hypothetical protein